LKVFAPFGVLYKKIKIAQYLFHLTWKREQEEEMRFQKRQVHTKKNPKFLPVIPLLPTTKLSLDELKDKAAYITFTLQKSQGLAPGAPTYRKSIRTFEEGDPAVDGSHHQVERKLGSEFNHSSN
jgi:hypothetical protein